MKCTATGYNLFCKEVSHEEGMKQLDCKNRFVAYATKWAALSPESQDDYRRRASQNSLSPKQKQKKWNKCVKKMLKLMDEMQSFQATSGYFVLVPKDGHPRYGGTPSGKIFVADEFETVVTGFCKGLDKQATTKEDVTVNDIRQLYNSKYAEALGIPGKRLPYKRCDTIRMEGLPEGIFLKRPQCYGTAQLRKIWNARTDIKCVLTSQL